MFTITDISEVWEKGLYPQNKKVAEFDLKEHNEILLMLAEAINKLEEKLEDLDKRTRFM
jgi:hypothetical protein